MTRFDTFDSVFPEFFTQTADYDLNEIFKKITAAAGTDPDIEKIVLRSRFEMRSHQIFEPFKNNYGHPLRNEKGENCYLRAASYIKNGQFTGRLFETLVPGELREISVVVVEKDSCFRAGVIYV